MNTVERLKEAQEKLRDVISRLSVLDNWQSEEIAMLGEVVKAIEEGIDEIKRAYDMGPN